MELSSEQQLAIQNGALVPILIGQAECIIVRKDVYEKAVIDIDPRLMYAAVLKAWDAEDENPSQYEEYLRDV